MTATVAPSESVPRARACGDERVPPPDRGIFRGNYVSKSTHISIAQPGLAEAIRSPRTMGLWEMLRRHRRAASAAEVAELCECGHAEAQRSLDLLERAMLVRKRRASRRRRAPMYEVTVQSISVVFDRSEPSEARLVREFEHFVANHLEDEHFRHEIPIERASTGSWGYYHCNPMYLEPADLRELKQRIARVEEFIRLLNDRQSESASTPKCNYATLLRVAPLGGSVMPQPHLRLVSRNIAESRRVSSTSSSRQLSRREREVALALRDGKSRAAVAKHLGISVLTLGTICKRAYRKLGINRVSQLQDALIDLALTGESPTARDTHEPPSGEEASGEAKLHRSDAMSRSRRAGSNKACRDTIRIAAQRIHQTAPRPRARMIQFP